jgi:hypothetical protein
LFKSALSAFEKNKINNQKKIKNYIKQSKRNYHFELKNERGHIVNVDNRSEFGDDLELAHGISLDGVAERYRYDFNSKEAATS